MKVRVVGLRDDSDDGVEVRDGGAVESGEGLEIDAGGAMLGREKRMDAERRFRESRTYQCMLESDVGECATLETASVTVDIVIM